MTNFSCEKCGKTFATSRGLRTHRIMKHNGQAPKKNKKRWAAKPDTERQARRALVMDLIHRLMIELDTL